LGRTNGRKGQTQNEAALMLPYAKLNIRLKEDK